MDGLVVLVRFELEDGSRPAFMDLIEENAKASVSTEPGCRRFDILSPRDGSTDVILYEIYDDPAAFEAHKAMPHYLAFRKAAEPMIRSLRLEELDLSEHAV